MEDTRYCHMKEAIEVTFSPAHVSAPFRMHRSICCIELLLPPELRCSDGLWQGLFSTRLQASESCVVEVKLALSGPFQSQPYSVSKPASSTTFSSCHLSIFIPPLMLSPEPGPKMTATAGGLQKHFLPRHNGPSSSRRPITCDSMRSADLRKELHVV